jgi:hypothetical protein
MVMKPTYVIFGNIFVTHLPEGGRSSGQNMYEA